MRHLIAALLLAAVPAAPLAAQADSLERVIADHWQWWLKNNPVQATTLGERRYDRELGDPSLAAADRQAAEAQAFVKRLDAIPDASLTPAQATDKAILRRLLDEQAEGNRFRQRSMNFTSYAGWFQGFAGLADYVPLRTRADHESYVARLEAFPRFNQAAIDVTRRALADGMVQPCATLAGTERAITGVVTPDVEQSRLYAPFRAAKPVDVGAADWRRLQARARTLIGEEINPEYTRLAAFFRTEYLPKCRQSVGISALPGGADYYAYRVRVETTTELTPDAIHRIGLAEVKRIRAEMAAVAKKAGQPSREAFIRALRTDPKYFAKTPEELMEAASRQAKIIDGRMPGLFGRLPRLPYGVREIPAETAEGTTTAYYMPGSPTSGIAGFYYVNTSKLDQRPLWEVPVLTVHEAVPGHHHQIALQQELDLPEFRKHAAFFTAFVEGWGLYSERLGIEMGLYDTPEKEMGRLSYQMWRACRLVVDTGIHAKGWSKERAVAFMRDNSALTDANIDAEVNRYISWPGQALAYKLGELRMVALREEAEKALGERFDLRGFHDAMLGQGSVPLDVLERQMKAWIAAERAKPRR